MREQILARLREALDVATANVSGGLTRIRGLAAEVVERVDGIELASVASGNDDAPAQPLSCLRFAALATARGKPVSEFLLIPFGEVVVERPVAGENFVFTRTHAEAAKRWFDQMGRKLAVDYEHQSFDRFNTRSDGLRPAAGWVGGLEVRDDGLWAVEVTWTERADELLCSGEYRYFSPVVFWTDEDHTDIAALGPVALTNDPAMRGVRPLAASRQLADQEPDSGPSSEPAAALRKELDTATAEIEVLRVRLADQAADAFIERGARLGKILDSTREDWRTDYLRDSEATEQRLSRAPVLLPPGRLMKLDRRGEVARLSPSKSAPVLASGALGQSVFEPEDLAAFERAQATGCVIAGGL